MALTGVPGYSPEMLAWAPGRLNPQPSNPTDNDWTPYLRISGQVHERSATIAATALVKATTVGVFSLGTEGFTTNLSGYSTAAGYSPTAGDLLVVFVAVSGSVSASPTLTESAGGGTYTRVGTAFRNTNANAVYCYVRDTLCENTTTRDFTWTSNPDDPATTCIFQISRITGMPRAGLAAIRQFKATDNVASGGTPATVFAGVPLPANPCIGAALTGANPPGLTEPSSFVELADVGQATPDAGLEVVSRDRGHTSATITWGSTSSAAYGAFAIELNASPSIAAYPDAVIADIPAAYWRLGESSGTNANDEIGTNDGTYVGGYTLAATGAQADNTAVTLNGTSGQINVALPTTVVNNWAMECWVKLANLSNQQAVIVTVGVDNAGGGYAMMVSNGSSGAGLKLGGYFPQVAWLDSGYTFSDTNYHHVVMTREAGTTKWYVDGTQTGTTSASTPGTPATLGTIGGHLWYGTTYRYFFNGTVDEVAVYPVALTQAKVSAHYAAGAPSGATTYERSAAISATAGIASAQTFYSIFERSAASAAATGIASASTFYSILERSAAASATGAVTSASLRVHLRSAALASTASIASAQTFYSILERSAAVGATGAVASLGIEILPRQSGISATATISASGARVAQAVERSAAAAATAAITSAPQRALLRQAAISATGAVASLGIELLPRATGINATTSIQVSGARVTQAVERSTALSATASVASAATFWTILERQAALAATSAIASAHQRDRLRAAALSATTSIASAQTFYSTLERATTTSATAAITAQPQRERLRSASLAATAAIQAAGSVGHLHTRSAALSASTGIAASPQRDHLRSVAVASTSGVQTTGQVVGQAAVYARAASLNATASIAGASQRGLLRSAALGATAGVASAAEFLTIFERSAALAASGTVASSAEFEAVWQRSTSLSASGAIASFGQRDLLRSAQLAASGSVATSGSLGRVLAAAVSINAVTGISSAAEWTYGLLIGATYGPTDAATYDLGVFTPAPDLLPSPDLLPGEDESTYQPDEGASYALTGAATYDQE